MVNWFKNNTKFYGLTTSSKNNLIETTFESGKSRSYLKNSLGKKTYSIKFMLWKKQDEIDFWTWYENSLLSRSETFQMLDVLTRSKQTEYKMTAEPKVDGSQYPKEVSIEIEEF